MDAHARMTDSISNSPGQMTVEANSHISRRKSEGYPKYSTIIEDL